jgi:hypothetical protein
MSRQVYLTRKVNNMRITFSSKCLLIGSVNNIFGIIWELHSESRDVRCSHSFEVKVSKNNETFTSC